MILRFFRRDPRRELVESLYTRIAQASRQPGLYTEAEVPDTVEGRFECLSLHVILTFRHLRTLPAPAADVNQDLADALFRALDLSLREMGVGDLAVPKKMKTLAEAFYGRARAYDPLLDARDLEALAVSLQRNVTGGEEPARRLAAYALDAEAGLKGQDLDAILADGPIFPTLEAGDAADDVPANPPGETR
ncbi:ubiquinol-cytochrome C chaperone family protein [Salinarimonas ramus]|uniref:Ubiquinol-cytochrome c chaperone n=1 Tax=Salinarimonas ramus TaxID=690164 RepID=A0A917V8V0_9HYPH|nr:ubiquinol-cytochrome C chaperone family protein [Salinarimonas ramus]GGK49937.1 ubiquinol-cytochrome c chaperone [Salinarimonas ramus]